MKYRSTYIAIALVWFLNLFDAICTAFWISTNQATEMNELMAALIDHGGLSSFILYKVAIGTLTMFVLWKHIHTHILARCGVWVALVVYSVIAAYHMSYAFYPDILLMLFAAYS